MSTEGWIPEVVARLESSKNQCFSASARRREIDPITGRTVVIVPARLARHVEHVQNDPAVLKTERSQCLFCRFCTPSTLFFVTRDGQVNVPRERDSLEAASQFISGKDLFAVQTFYDLVKTLEPLNAAEQEHLARVFRNLTPAMDVAHGEWCTVTALHPAYHDYECHDLPADAMVAFVRSWQVQEAIARIQQLSFSAFMNGGKRRESGQSVACCHGQAYAVRRTPALYKHIADRRNQIHGGSCPVCRDVLQPSSLKVYGIWCPDNSEVVVLAHPAPLHDWSLLILPRDHVENLRDVKAADLAAALQAGVRGLRGQFGVEPAFNIVVRTGPQVGHVHAEIIPRTNVNILAGWEIAAHEIVITVDPERVARELSIRVP